MKKAYYYIINSQGIIKKIFDSEDNANKQLSLLKKGKYRNPSVFIEIFGPYNTNEECEDFEEYYEEDLMG